MSLCVQAVPQDETMKERQAAVYFRRNLEVQAGFRFCVLLVCRSASFLFRTVGTIEFAEKGLQNFVTLASRAVEHGWKKERKEQTERQQQRNKEKNEIAT